MYEYACEVVGVIDGDTLKVKIDLGFDVWTFQHVRVAGVDTPEVFGPKAVPAGKVASAFTKDWVAHGITFRIVSLKYDDREKYGRVLAQVYRDADPVSLTEALIASGNGKAIKAS
jgi:micrococcal nuclease